MKTHDLVNILILSSLSFPLLAEEHLESNISFQVTVIKNSLKESDTSSYTSDTPNRTFIPISSQGSNKSQALLINNPSHLPKDENIQYQLNINPVKFKKDSHYQLELSANKTSFNNVKELLKPIILTVNNPSYKGQIISPNNLPNGYYVSDMELIVKHHW